MFWKNLSIVICLVLKLKAHLFNTLVKRFFFQFVTIHFNYKKKKKDPIGIYKSPPKNNLKRKNEILNHRYKNITKVKKKMPP